MIASGADLWTQWTERGVLRPRDYDTEVADLIWRAIGEQPSPDARALPTAMDRVGWSARDLLRGIRPALLSFSGMLSDLLALYARVDAARAGDENLQIQYEFEDGEQLDEELKPFRSTVQRLKRSVQETDAFRFTNALGWNNPFRERAMELGLSPLDLAPSILGLAPSSSMRDWPFAAEFPSPQVDNPELSRVIAAHRQVIVAALRKLEEYGKDLNEASPPPAGAGPVSDLYYAATDFWAPAEIALHNLGPRLLADLPPTEQSRLIEEQVRWLDRFWQPADASIEQSIEEVTDVLSLPHWGRRHELYSAWVVAAIDNALESHLQFDVTDGVLSFPFRATLLARLSTASGGFELWTEKRFVASGPLAGGRKQAIQPDLTFLSATPPNRVIAAVEAKQYLRASGRKHGETARDYSANLPDAQVFLVGHGPLGRSVIEHVASADRPRVALHPDLRPGQSAALARFASNLAALFPQPTTSPSEMRTAVVAAAPPLTKTGDSEHPFPSHRIGTVALAWAPEVHDLDLHLVRDDTGEEVSFACEISDHAELDGDRFDGGPECAIVRMGDYSVHVEVRLFSRDVTSLLEAHPRVTITMLGFHGIFRPAQSLGVERTWHVATIEASGVVKVADSTAIS